MAKRQMPDRELGAENAEEIISVLNAISLVSARMARKLAVLEQQIEKGEVGTRGKVAVRPGHAHKGHTV